MSFAEMYGTNMDDTKYCNIQTNLQTTSLVLVYQLATRPVIVNTLCNRESSELRNASENLQKARSLSSEYEYVCGVVVLVVSYRMHRVGKQESSVLVQHSIQEVQARSKV